MEKLKTIFGKKKRPYKRKSTPAAPQVCIETPDYNLTIFKIHFGRLTVKLYDKGERTLRAEVVVQNTKDLKCKRGINSFNEIVEKLETIMCSFLSNIDYAHVATIDDSTFEKLVEPSQSGTNRLASIDLNKKKQKHVASALLYLSMKPGGFTSLELSNVVKERFTKDYSRRNASYDIKKFRGKGMVTKISGSIKYCVIPMGVSTLSAVLCMLTKEIPAVVSVVNSQYSIYQKEKLKEVEIRYLNVQKEIDKIRNLKGIKMAA